MGFICHMHGLDTCIDQTLLEHTQPSIKVLRTEYIQEAGKGRLVGGESEGHRMDTIQDASPLFRRPPAFPSFRRHVALLALLALSYRCIQVNPHVTRVYLSRPRRVFRGGVSVQYAHGRGLEHSGPFHSRVPPRRSAARRGMATFSQRSENSKTSLLSSCTPYSVPPLPLPLRPAHQARCMCMCVMQMTPIGH